MYQYKFVLVGDSGVGKTALCNRFCTNSFNENQPETIGLEFGVRIIDINNTQIKLQIWDTAGQERFRAIGRQYYRASSAVFLVYDVSNRATFAGLDSWVEDAISLSPTNAIKVMIGNKTDLNKREVSYGEAKDFADQHGLCYFETSALSGERIEDAFIQTANQVYSQMKSTSHSNGKLSDPVVVDLEDQNPNSCFC